MGYSERATAQVLSMIDALCQEQSYSSTEVETTPQSRTKLPLNRGHNYPSVEAEAAHP